MTVMKITMRTEILLHKEMLHKLIVKLGLAY